MEKKYLLVSLEDERAKKISEVLGSKTCKKIIDFLAEENEASEKDIADSIKLPLNTTEYNLKKLLHAEIVEKTQNFFWSAKGKKIPMYRLSDKSIVISPKSSKLIGIKSILPVALISGIGALVIRQYFILKNSSLDIKSYENIFSGASEFAVESSAATQSNVWLWFFAGAIFSLFVIILINSKKSERR